MALGAAGRTRRTRARRRGAACGAAAAAVAALALTGAWPAGAVPGPPADTAPPDSNFFDSDFGAGYTFAPAPATGEPVTRYAEVRIGHTEPNAAAGPATFTADASGLAGVADVVWPDSCTAAGTHATCTSPAIPAGTLDFAPVYLGIRPLPGATAPAQGSITVRMPGPGGKTLTLRSQIRLAHGPSLAVTGPAAPPAPGSLAPGDPVPVGPVVIANKGDRPAPAVTVVLGWSSRVPPAHRFSNCSYAALIAHCLIRQPLEPGTAYQLTADLTAASAPDAYNETLYLHATPAAADAQTPPGTPGDGPALTLRPVPADQARDDARNDDAAWYERLAFTNTADFAVTAPPVTGRPGGTVTATVTLTNHGPASIDPPRYDLPAAVVDVTLPDGTTLAGPPPSYCHPRDTAKHYYRCNTPTENDRETEGGGTLTAHTHLDFTFTLRLDPAFTHATGQATLLTTGPNQAPTPFDHHPANNTTRLTITTTNTTGTSTSTGTSAGTSTAQLADTGTDTSTLALTALTATALLTTGTLTVLRTRHHHTTKATENA